MSSSDEESDLEICSNINERIFRPWIFFDDANLFKERFRLYPRQAEILLQLLGDDLKPQTYRSHALTAKKKLLCALRFYASNSFFYAIGDSEGYLKKIMAYIC